MTEDVPTTPASPTVAEQRRYKVLTVAEARRIAGEHLTAAKLADQVVMGLPEIDDRYHVWRVPLSSKSSGDYLGQVVIDAKAGDVSEARSTDVDRLRSRLLSASAAKSAAGKTRKKSDPVVLSQLPNILAVGDAATMMAELPAESVDLVFTSPPYYNARPEYSEYDSYAAYLESLRRVIREGHRVLGEGRMFVMNVSAVLQRRVSRNHSSKRIAVPFDIHRLFIEEGFEFIDDIMWLKPSGAGWATGRGRRFAADRNPMQYKAVPVTEYILVYRKETDRLIDWHIRNHPKPELVAASKIPDGYQATNVWKIQPAWSKEHPAIFPEELCENVVRYYSFVEDVVLDPYAGSGTLGRVAARLGRRFVLCEIDPVYARGIARDIPGWKGVKGDVSFIGDTAAVFDADPDVEDAA